MFGFFTKQRGHTGRSEETMTQEGRLRFIRRLVRERFAADPNAQFAAGLAGEEVNSLPDAMILGTPDSLLALIAEQQVGGRQRGVSDAEIVRVMHRDFKVNMEPLSPFPFPPLPELIDLWGYARYLLDSQHGHGVPISNNYIDHVFTETFKFYNFSGWPRRVVVAPIR